MSNELRIVGSNGQALANRKSKPPEYVGRLLRCHDPEGNPIFINPDEIVMLGTASVRQGDGPPTVAIGLCGVILRGGTQIVVASTPETVATAIAEHIA